MARISLKERVMEHKSRRGLFIAGDGVRPPAETKREGGETCAGKASRLFYTRE